ncbi:hypothetical protein D0859_14603 [Hortaea werneckii]|uniref:Fungal N-terminal domain-containing protein n=1 Tax=Hortaea werneckii TaxID=91943 RepID=A0A3M7I717_HORWE|nr:hypothetical protein D0859_14603 [Hortaea werneckii]
MPTGLEEASAILTFVQVGFSLARTFTTLIGEYREAPDELATLANAIVDTLAHIETIKRLLEENETTHGWNANGIDLATSCLQEAERLVKRIVTLLRRSGADIPSNDRIGPEDISISVLRRVAWSRFTGRIGKINESLAATRQKMLLILTLYRAYTVNSQEEQRLARDRVIVLVRGSQVQRARRKYPGQHSNTPSKTQRVIRNEQEDDPVAQDTGSSRERSQQVLDGNGPETTTVAVPELPARLNTLDEAKNVHDVENSQEHNQDAHERCENAESPLKETQETSASPDESTKAANSPTVSPGNRPADDEATPTAVEGQSDLSVNQEQKCPPNSDEAKIENLVATACAMDDAVLLQFGEAFNPPLTADQVRKLLQKAPSITKEVANNADGNNGDPKTLHRHNLSSGHEDLSRVDGDVDEDAIGAPCAESVATYSSCKTVKVTKMRHLKILFSRLILRKKAAASLCHFTPESIESFGDTELVERLRTLHIGKWTLTKRMGFRSKSCLGIATPYRSIHELKVIAFSPAPSTFLSFLVTLSPEGCSIAPAHLSRDELDGRLWHAATSNHGPEASLTSQIYAGLPLPAYRMIDQLLEDLGKFRYEIQYAEVMGVGKSKAERMIRRKASHPGTSLMGNRVLLVFYRREGPKLGPESGVQKRENPPTPDWAQDNQDQVGPNSPVRVHRVNDGANHTDPVQEMMRAEQMKKMKREREIEEEEKMKKEKEREEQERKKKIEEEEREHEKKQGGDEIDNDEEEEVFGNLAGLSDDELVQRLLEMYTNTHSLLEARDEE